MLPATGTARQTKPRGEIRRRQVLDAAIEVFLKNGYSGATIDLVIEQAGASKATVYAYFGDKDGLFAAIIEDRSAYIMSAFGELDAAPSDIPSALTHIARRYLETLLSPEVVGLCRLIIAEGPRFPNLARTFYRLGPDCVIARLSRTFADWNERHLIRIPDPELTAMQFLEALGGDLQKRAMAGIPLRNRRLAIERNINAAVDLIWLGMRPGRGRP